MADGDLPPRPVAPVTVVDLLDEVRDPTNAGLDAADAQVGEALEDTGEDQVADRRRDRREHRPQTADGLGLGLAAALAVEGGAGALGLGGARGLAGLSR